MDAHFLLEDEDQIHWEQLQEELQRRDNVLLVDEPIASMAPQAAATIPLGTPVARVIELMQAKPTSAVLIVNPDETLAGIFTERDVVTALFPDHLNDLDHLPIESVMTADPATLTTADNIAYALNLLGVQGYRHIPLVDAHGRPEAMLRFRDIILHVTEKLAKSIINIPPSPQTPQDRHGG